MDANGNADDVPQAPLISINVQGKARLNMVAPVSNAYHGSISRTSVSAGDGRTGAVAVPPFWHRTSVIWSAVAALAAVATVVVTWALAR
ncbi:hypothetical protein [Kitasatospora sp. NPDC050463]|uniref:hypothetical protein n=1 Tax=Kitasatospora sp. NPDC050463 TaxID=3155786 RepID=UPI0034097294